MEAESNTLAVPLTSTSFDRNAVKDGVRILAAQSPRKQELVDDDDDSDPEDFDKNNLYENPHFTEDVVQNGHLLDDVASYKNLVAFKEWMYRGFLVPWDRKKIKTAFRILKHDIPDSDAANGDVEGLILGPAVKYAFAGNLFTWLCFPVVIGTGVAIVEPPDCTVCGIAAFPSVTRKSFWILFAIFMACTIISLACEYCASMFVLPSQAIPCGGPKRKWMTFNRWISLMMVLSFFAHIDIFTTGIFMSRVWKSAHDCPILEQEWQEIVHNSAFLNTMPIINTVSFHSFTALVVLIMSCQFLYALCYSIPVSPNLAGDYRPESFWDKNLPDYQLCQVSDEEHKKAVALYNQQYNHIYSFRMTQSPDGRNAPPTRAALRRRKINEYNTPLKVRTGHGRAVQALADAGRMYTLNWFDDLYLEQAESKWGIDQMCLEMQRTLVRFFLFGVQATMIPYLQVSYIGFQNSCSPVAFQSETGEAKVSSLLTVFSAVLALATGANYIIFEVVSLRKHWNQLRLARKNLQNKHPDDANNQALTRANWWEPQRLARKAGLTLIFGILMGFVFTLLYLYTLVKATMIIIICPEYNRSHRIAGWNMHLDPLQGCVLAE